MLPFYIFLFLTGYTGLPWRYAIVCLISCVSVGTGKLAPLSLYARSGPGIIRILEKNKLKDERRTSNHVNPVNLHQIRILQRFTLLIVFCLQASFAPAPAPAPDLPRWADKACTWMQRAVYCHSVRSIGQ